MADVGTAGGLCPAGSQSSQACPAWPSGHSLTWGLLCLLEFLPQVFEDLGSPVPFFLQAFPFLLDVHQLIFHLETQKGTSQPNGLLPGAWEAEAEGLGV